MFLTHGFVVILLYHGGDSLPLLLGIVLEVGLMIAIFSFG